MLCCWGSHFTLTVLHSTLVYMVKPVVYLRSECPYCWGGFSRGRDHVNSGFVWTKRTVSNIDVSVLHRGLSVIRYLQTVRVAWQLLGGRGWGNVGVVNWLSSRYIHYHCGNKWLVLALWSCENFLNIQITVLQGILVSLVILFHNWPPCSVGNLSEY